MTLVATLRSSAAYRGQIVRVLAEPGSAQGTGQDGPGAAAGKAWQEWVMAWRSRPPGTGRSEATAPPIDILAALEEGGTLFSAVPPGWDRIEAVTQYCVLALVRGESPVLVLVPGSEASLSLAGAIRDALAHTFQWPGVVTSSAQDSRVFQVGSMEHDGGSVRADYGDLQDAQVLIATYKDFITVASGFGTAFTDYLATSGAIAAVAPDSLDEATLAKVNGAFLAIGLGGIPAQTQPVIIGAPRTAVFAGSAADEAALALQLFARVGGGEGHHPIRITPRRKVTVLWWQPPLELSDIVLEPDESASIGAFATVRRVDFEAEMFMTCRNILKDLEAEAGTVPSRVVIMEAGLPLGSHHRSELQRQLTDTLPGVAFQVTASLEALPVDWFGTVDLLMPIGWDWGDEELVRHARAVLRDGGACCVMMVETAESFARSRPTERGGDVLSRARRLLPSALGPEGYIAGPSEVTGAAHLTTHPQVGEGWRLTPTDYLLHYYAGAVVERSGVSYVAGPAKDDAVELSFASTGATPARTFPVLQFEFESKDVQLDSSREAVINGITCTPATCTMLEVRCTATRAMDSIARPHDRRTVNFPQDSAPTVRYGDVRGIRFSCQSPVSPVALGQLLSLYLGAEYPAAFREVAFIPSDAGEHLHVFPVGANGASLTRQLAAQVDSMMVAAGRYVWRLATGCRCAHGCPRCVRPALVPFEVQAASPLVDKRSMIDLAGSLAGVSGQEIAAWGDYLTQGLPAAALEPLLRVERAGAMAVLADAFGVVWTSTPSIAVGDPALMAERKAAGLYLGPEGKPAAILIAEGMPAATTFAVVAHELAHHYQALNGNFDWIGFKAAAEAQKLDELRYSEGFADWMAFRAVDLAGLVSDASRIAMSPDMRYGDGMRWWLELESRVGAGKVLELAREAEGALKA